VILEDMRNIVKIINITGEHEGYIEKIQDFMNALETEKRYFKLTMDRIICSEIIFVATIDNRIVGIGGIEIKHHIPRIIIMLKKEVHGKGIGKELLSIIHHESVKYHNIIMAIIEDGNTAAFRLFMSWGYISYIKRNKLCYLLYPLNRKGLITYWGLMIISPFIKIFDIIQK